MFQMQVLTCEGDNPKYFHVAHQIAFPYVISVMCWSHVDLCVHKGQVKHTRQR